MVATQFASPDDDLFNEASLKESIAEASSDDDEAEKDEVEAFTIVLAEIAWPEWPKVSLLKRTNFNKLIKPPDRTNELIWDHLNGLPYAQDLRKKEKEKVKPTPEEIALRKIERLKRQLEADYPDVEKPQVERDAIGRRRGPLADLGARRRQFGVVGQGPGRQQRLARLGEAREGRERDERRVEVGRLVRRAAALARGARGPHALAELGAPGVERERALRHLLVRELDAERLAPEPLRERALGRVRRERPVPPHALLEGAPLGEAQLRHGPLEVLDPAPQAIGRVAVDVLVAVAGRPQEGRRGVGPLLELAAALARLLAEEGHGHGVVLRHGEEEADLVLVLRVLRHRLHAPAPNEDKGRLRGAAFEPQ